MVNINILKSTVWDQSRPYLEAKALDLKGLTPTAGVVRLYNSEQRFLGLGLYSPEAPQVLAWLAADDQPLSEILAELITKAQKHRSDLFKPHHTYRLIHDAADGLPGVTIDWLAGCAVLSTRTSGADALLDTLTNVLDKLLQPATIVVKNNAAERTRRGLPLRDAVLVGFADDAFTLVENAASYEYSLAELAPFPLAQRPLRSWMRDINAQNILTVGLASTHLLPMNHQTRCQDIGDAHASLSDLTVALRRLPPQANFDAALWALPPLSAPANRTAAHHLLHQICLRLKDGAHLLLELHDAPAALLFLRRFVQKSGQSFSLLDQMRPGPDFPTDLRQNDREPVFLRLRVTAKTS